MDSAEGGSLGRVVGRYAFHEEIAAGGMASIFLGKMCGPVGFTPIVAIKKMHPQYSKDPEFVRMFVDEARLASRIRHPNIVPVTDVHAEGDELFLVLEYVHGESLGRLVSAGRRAGVRLPQAIVAAIICDVLHGLHAAHEARDEQGEPLGIVHRDVSPQNILVGSDGVARVLDFGVAKAAGRVSSTRDGQVKGKLGYMAPEHVRGEVVDRRADIYAASVVLWESLAGERLFRAENEGHMVERMLFGAISPPSSVRPDIPPALDSVVMRGLSRERSDRFATAKELALALAAAVVPASTTEVGEWVEAHALDALEERAKLVAEVLARKPVEAVVASAPVPSSLTPGPAALPPAAPRARRPALSVGLGALVVVALFVGYGVRTYATGAVAPPAAPAAPEKAPPSASASVTPVPPAPPSAAAAASSPVPLPSPSAEGVPPRANAAGAPPVRGTGRGKVSSPTTKPCQTRGPSGEYTFDKECLRGSQR